MGDAWKVVVIFVIGSACAFLAAMTLTPLLLSGKLNPVISDQQYRQVYRPVATLLCFIGGGLVGLFICTVALRKSP